MMIPRKVGQGDHHHRPAGLSLAADLHATVITPHGAAALVVVTGLVATAVVLGVVTTAIVAAVVVPAIVALLVAAIVAVTVVALCLCARAGTERSDHETGRGNDSGDLHLSSSCARMPGRDRHYAPAWASFLGWAADGRPVTLEDDWSGEFSAAVGVAA
jgi:hypothetical protein